MQPHDNPFVIDLGTSRKGTEQQSGTDAKAGKSKATPMRVRSIRKIDDGGAGRAARSGQTSYTIVRDTQTAPSDESMAVTPYWVSAKLKTARIDFHGGDMLGGGGSAEVYFIFMGGVDGEDGGPPYTFEWRSNVLDVDKDGGFHTFEIHRNLFSRRLCRWSFWIGAYVWEEDYGWSQEAEDRLNSLSDSYWDELNTLGDGNYIPWDSDGQDYAEAGAALGAIFSEILASFSDDPNGEQIIKFDRSALKREGTFEVECEMISGNDVNTYLTFEIKSEMARPLPAYPDFIAKDLYVPPSLMTGIFTGITNYMDFCRRFREYTLAYSQAIDDYADQTGRTVDFENTPDPREGQGYGLAPISAMMASVVYDFTEEEWRTWEPLFDNAGDRRAWFDKARLMYSITETLVMDVLGLTNPNWEKFYTTIFDTAPTHRDPPDDTPAESQYSIYQIAYTDRYYLGGVVERFAKGLNWLHEGMPAEIKPDGFDN